MFELRQAMLAKADHDVLEAKRLERERQNLLNSRSSGGRRPGGRWIVEDADIDDPE